MYQPLLFLFNTSQPVRVENGLKQIIAIGKNGKSPDLKVNDKQLQTAFLVYIFDDITECQCKLIWDDDDYWARKLSSIKFTQGR